MESSESHPIFQLIEQENMNDIINTYLKTEESDFRLWEITQKTEDNRSVLHAIAQSDYHLLMLEMINYLKKKLSKEQLTNYINKPTNQGTVALHYAAFNGNIQTIELLIKNGADVNIKTKTGLSVIHYGSQGNQPNTLVYFHLKYSMRVDEGDLAKSTPLHWAAYLGSELSFGYLLNYKWNHSMNINIQDNKGYTPLHLTVFKKQTKIAKKLLQKGASTEILDKDGKTCLQLSKEKQAFSIYYMLKESQKCQLCAFKAPIKKLRHPNTNIGIVFIMQILSFVLITCFFTPVISFKISECNRIKWYLYTYFLLTVVFMLIYVYLIFSNSGVIPKRPQRQLLEELNKNINLDKICPICLVEIRPSSKHCVICNKCVDQFDHHCYWVNNCIGRKNYWMFIFFLVYSIIDLVYVISSGIFTLIYNFYEVDESFCELENIWKVLKFFQDKVKHFDLNTKYSITIFIVSVLFVLLGLLFLIPVILLCGCHSKNAFAKIKTQGCKCSKKKQKRFFYDKHLMNEIDSIGVAG